MPARVTILRQAQQASVSPQSQNDHPLSPHRRGDHRCRRRDHHGGSSADRGCSSGRGATRRGRRAAVCMYWSWAPWRATKSCPSSWCMARAAIWKDLRLALGDRLAVNRRVILVDRPGHGRSDRPGGAADASPARQATLIAQALDRIASSVLCSWGHSLGGTIATAFALAYPDRIVGPRTPRSGDAPMAGRPRLVQWNSLERRCSVRCLPARSRCRSVLCCLMAAPHRCSRPKTGTG